MMGIQMPMTREDFFKSLKDDPRRLRSFLADPVTTLKAHGVDPATVDTSHIPAQLPDALHPAKIGWPTSAAVASAASAAVG
jgi:hypothetical protein